MTTPRTSSSQRHAAAVYAGCFTLPGQADPFEPRGGIPHDRSVVGRGVRLLGLSLEDGTLATIDDDDDDAVIIGEGTVPNPSYVCLSPPVPSDDEVEDDDEGGGGTRRTRRYLYAVSEVDDEESAVVAAFEILSSPDGDEAGGGGGGGRRRHRLVGKFGAMGTIPAHVVAFASPPSGSIQRHHLLCSNYGTDAGGSSVSLYDIHPPTGALTLSDTVRPSGSSGSGSEVDPLRQRASHAHCAVPKTISGMTYVYASDLGADVVVTYRLLPPPPSSSSPDTGGATTTAAATKLEEVSRFSAPPGSGPRSVAIHPSLDVAAVTLEMAAEVLLLGLEGDGSVRDLGRNSVVPPGWPREDDSDQGGGEGEKVGGFNGGRWASDACWSIDGRYLYAAARLHDSVSAFRLDDDDDDGPTTKKKLRLVRRVPSRGVTPRTLCVTPDGRYLLVAHQHSHSVCSFRINDANGELTFVDSATVPLAACVKVL